MSGTNGGRPPGTPKTGGRAPGQTNRIPRDVKEMILAALRKKGGVGYLMRQADENPVAFMSLLGKLIPRDIKGDIKVKGEFTLVDLLTAIDKPERAQLSPEADTAEPTLQ